MVARLIDGGNAGVIIMHVSVDRDECTASQERLGLRRVEYVRQKTSEHFS